MGNDVTTFSEKNARCRKISTILLLYPPSDWGNDNDQGEFGSQVCRWQNCFHQTSSLKNLVEQPPPNLHSFCLVLPQPGPGPETWSSSVFKLLFWISCSTFTYLTYLFLFWLFKYILPQKARFQKINIVLTTHHK